MSARPTYRWKLVQRTPGALVETKFRSRPALDRAVAAVREGIAAGSSRVTAITVYEWDVVGSRWVLHERLPLTGGA